MISNKVYPDRACNSKICIDKMKFDLKTLSYILIK